jgi:hypothetical protein
MVVVVDEHACFGLPVVIMNRHAQGADSPLVDLGRERLSRARGTAQLQAAWRSDLRGA